MFLKNFMVFTADSTYESVVCFPSKTIDIHGEVK